MGDSANKLIKKLRDKKMLTDGKYVYALSSVKCIDGKDADVVCAYMLPFDVYDVIPYSITHWYDWCELMKNSDREPDEFIEWDKPLTSQEAEEYMHLNNGAVVDAFDGLKYFARTIDCPGSRYEAAVFSCGDIVAGLSMECLLNQFANAFDGHTFYIDKDSE